MYNNSISRWVGQLIPLLVARNNESQIKMYVAYEQDRISITTNVKEFLLYPFLFWVNEERLYDLRKNKLIFILESDYVLNDKTLKEYLAEFF